MQKFIKHDKKAILAGDFNMIENIFLDRQGGNPNNTQTIGIQYLNCIKNNHKLIDIWRETNPYKRYFTYHNAGNTIYSRLDRIYITKTVKTKTCQIMPTSISDHECVSVSLQVNKKEPKGPIIWELNTTILKQKKFQKIFKNFWNSW